MQQVIPLSLDCLQVFGIGTVEVVHLRHKVFAQPVNHGDGNPQLMGEVGEEVGTHLFQIFQLYRLLLFQLPLVEDKQ